MEGNWYVYVLYSEKLQMFYKGQTRDLAERLRYHNEGLERFTRHGVPWRLIWFTLKPNRGEALILENKLKNLSRQRLARFILKYRSGLSPDELAFVSKLSGC
ncbi:MAG: GIY-YIG nuclease family protein [Bacteroidetes bacterium]|nr:GIY-YIG nuclease family protein [Bacteroidota bacterium]